jgi:hypothetical protein
MPKSERQNDQKKRQVCISSAHEPVNGVGLNANWMISCDRLQVIRALDLSKAIFAERFHTEKTHL